MDTDSIRGITTFLAALFVALWFFARRSRRSQSSTDTEETASASEANSELQALYEVAAQIEQSSGPEAHPRDYLHNKAFVQAVRRLARKRHSPDQLADCLYEENAIVACIAIEALKNHKAGDTAMPRLLDGLRVLDKRAVWFTLRYLAAVVPIERSITGAVLARLDHRANDFDIRAYVEEFIRDRLTEGEVPQLEDELADLSIDEIYSVRSFIDNLDPELMRPYQQPIAELLERRIAERHVNVDLLRSIGLVWDAGHAAAADQIIEHSALTNVVQEAEASLAEGRRSVLLVGDEGVGKATTVALLARRLHAQGWTIFQAGHAELIAGQTYLGQLEGRVQMLLRELCDNPRVLWIVPDFQNLAVAGLHQYSAVSVLDTLLPHLQSGAVTIISAIQPAAYQRLVQWMPAIAASLTIRRIEPMPAEDAKALALAWLDRRMAPATDGQQIVAEAWELSQQFLTNRQAPGNLLELLNLTLRRLAAAGPSLSDAADPRPVVGIDDLMLTLTGLTGLPVALLDQRKQLDIESLQRAFNERVLGQAEAVQCLVERVAMLKAGLNDPTRPAGVFLFAGPTGTGKTEIAKTLAEWLFGSQERMIRLDMSEFQSPDDLGRIVGEANASDTEALVGRIRKQPFSVILLDEFEKAHPRVWDIFLQVFDDGRLTGRTGLTTDFRHSIIILTSNLGSVIPTGPGLGFRANEQTFDTSSVMRTIEQTFRKEFINRLDRVVVFRPLTRELMRQILEKELTTAMKRRGLRSRPWAVEWDEAAIDFLLDKGFTPDLGARPLKRAVDRYVLSPLAITIVKHRVPAGDQFLFVTRRQNALDVQFVDPDAPEDDEVATGREPPVEDEGPLSLTLTGIALTPQGTPAEIAFLRARHEELCAIVEAEAWGRAKAEHVAAMKEPGFWDGADRFPILDMIERRDRVESALRRAGSLLRRLAGGRGNARDAYPEHLVRLLSQNLYLLGLAVADTEAARPSDAIIRITAGRDGSAPSRETVRFAEQLAAMYRAWAGKRRMQFKTVEERRSDDPSAYTMVALAGGFGAYTILSREHGLHVFEQPTKEHKSFDRLRVSVEVAPQPVSANGADPKAQIKQALTRVEQTANLNIVRRYRDTPSPLVRDNVNGWRTGRLDLILGGDFDLIDGRIQRA